MNCHAKRLECVQLVHPPQCCYGGRAGAVVRRGEDQKREQAPRTPNASRGAAAPLHLCALALSRPLYAASTGLAVRSRSSLSSTAARSGRTRSRRAAPFQGDWSSRKVQFTARAASAACHLSLITKQWSRFRRHLKPASTSNPGLGRRHEQASVASCGQTKMSSKAKVARSNSC